MNDLVVKFNSQPRGRKLIICIFLLCVAILLAKSCGEEKPKTVDITGQLQQQPAVQSPAPQPQVVYQDSPAQTPTQPQPVYIPQPQQPVVVQQDSGGSFLHGLIAGHLLSGNRGSSTTNTRTIIRNRTVYKQAPRQYYGSRPSYSSRPSFSSRPSYRSSRSYGGRRR